MKNSPKGAISGGGREHEGAAFSKLRRKKDRSLRTKAAKFKVYTQAQGLAGIITTHSSVTVTLLSLTSARVTHTYCTHAHTHPICILIAISIARSQTPSVTFL